MSYLSDNQDFWELYNRWVDEATQEFYEKYPELNDLEIEVWEEGDVNVIGTFIIFPKKTATP
ncbi:MAG: hypothetical protein QXS54_12215, partial [Candidatus Methanomethylicaceae archaeon]